MELPHDSTILGQLRKGQAEANQRLDAIRIELQRLNVHLEQLSAVISAHRDPPTRTYPARLYISQAASTLRPKALAMSAQARHLSRSLRTKKIALWLSPQNGSSSGLDHPPERTTPVVTDLFSRVDDRT
jgi:hypothetical protein